MLLIKCDCVVQTQGEVIEAVEIVPWQSVKRGKHQVRRTYSFGKPSPINRQVYPFKTVHVIFADEPGEIVIVTVLVYYGDRRMDDEDSL
jgi:hypothetical protein